MGRARHATKDKLLDAAERLFARKGFHGSTLREITRMARVDVALVRYYFGGKRQLFDAVLERRGTVLDTVRLERLREVREAAAPHPASSLAVLGAFFDPILERITHAEPGWQSYFSLVAWVNNSREWGRKLMSKTFDSTALEFIHALLESLPGASPEDIYWGYTFLTGALTLSLAQTGRVETLSKGLCRSSDIAALKSRLAPFVAGGFATLANHEGLVSISSSGRSPSRSITS